MKEATLDAIVQSCFRLYPNILEIARIMETNAP